MLHDDLTPVLDDLVDGVRAALGEQFVGAYLVGSFALGTADEWSDVDVVVVTDGPPSADVEAGLVALHAQLPEGGGWAARLEVSYAAAADLRSPMSLGRRWPYVAPGSQLLERSDHDNTAHTRWVLREHGTVLAGPPAAGLVAPVSAEALRAEALGLARARAEELEDEPAAYADPTSRTALVLASCQTLWTASHASVVSTVEAATWSLSQVERTHHALLRRAICDRRLRWDVGPRSPELDLISPTRAFVWDVVWLAGTWALEARGTK